MVARYVLPALAAAGAVYAQCSDSATKTIQNAGDASGLASCSTFSGSIAVASGTTDEINIDGVQEIDGDLVVSNASQLTSLGGDSLESIKGTFNLDTVQVLNSLTFPKLSNVDELIWNALPNLQQLSFTSEIRTAGKVDIQNTQLHSLEGINLETVDSVYLANNNYLDEVNMQLGNVSTGITLQANGVNLQAEFPNLEWAFNLTFRNCASIATPSLKSVNGSLGFYSNMMQNFSAANLTEVGGSLSFVSNTQLTNLSFPQLESVGGGLQVANNTKLDSINGFEKLKSVSGALDCNGNFTSIEFPALSDVKGAFNIQSSGDISDDCSHFKGLSGNNNAIKGKFTCSGDVAKPGGAGTNPSSTAGSSSSHSGAAPGLDVSSNGMMTVTGIIAAALGML